MAITLLDNLQYYFNLESDPLQPARYGFTVYYLSDNPYIGHKGIWPGEEGPAGCDMYHEAKSYETEEDDFSYLFSYIAPPYNSSMVIALENFTFTNFETYFYLLHTKEQFESWVSENLFDGKTVKYTPATSLVERIEWGENQGVAILKPSVFDKTKITDDVKYIVISAIQTAAGQRCPLVDRADLRVTYSETKGPVFPSWNFDLKIESINEVNSSDTCRELKYHLVYGLSNSALTFGVRFLTWKNPAANVYTYLDYQIAYTRTISLGSSFRWIPAPYLQDAHGPEWLAYVWPGTYKDDDSDIKQLCTKAELGPCPDFDEWPEPEKGGSYSYPGHWDCCNFYSVGLDYDDYSLAYKSGVGRDQYQAVRRTWQTIGIKRDRNARYMPPSTSRDGGNEQDCCFGSDENTTVFGLERPNIMISQSGRYHDEAPTWDLHTGTYQELIENDIQEMSIPRSYGAPLRVVDGVTIKDWDAILPISWFTYYDYWMWTCATTDQPTYENCLFVNCQEYPGPRIIEGTQSTTDLVPNINAFRWPEEKPRESGGERQYKQKRLALTNFPWIPCVGAIEATEYQNARVGKIPLMEEQENVYIDGQPRSEQNNQWPADRTINYCSVVRMHGIKYDETFFQGTAPATADSLHHAPDMSGEVAGSSWFNPSKVFGRNDYDRQQAYLPPCGFNMNFVRADRRSSRVFYPTRKGYIKADYTSKSLSVLQEVDEYYMSTGECTLSYISPNRKAYTATYGTVGSPATYNLTSSIYSSQTMVDAILQRLRIRSECKHNTEVTFPKNNFDISHISGVDSISIDLTSETVTLSYKHV